MSNASAAGDVGLISLPARVRRASNLPPSPDSFANAILGWTSGVTFVYAGLFGTGSLIYGRVVAAVIWGAIFVVSGTGLVWVLLRLSSDDAEPPVGTSFSVDSRLGDASRGPVAGARAFP